MVGFYAVKRVFPIAMDDEATTHGLVFLMEWHNQKSIALNSEYYILWNINLSFVINRGAHNEMLFIVLTKLFFAKILHRVGVQNYLNPYPENRTNC